MNELLSQLTTDHWPRTTVLAFTWPIRLEYFSGWIGLGIFVALAIPIVWLGMRSLNGLGPVRKWVAIGVRLLVLGVMILILGGVRWQREHKDLEVMVLRDTSDSTSLVRQYPGETLQASVEDSLREMAKTNKPPEDRVGVLSFNTGAQIDAMPNTTLMLDARAIREGGTGTDIASAIQLALATLGRDAMHRMVLVSDGNATSGDLDAALNAAAAQHVPIDVMPLRYDVSNEVIVERFVAPTWKRENEPFSIDVILRSTNLAPVTGKLRVLHGGIGMDLDPYTAGVQDTRVVTLKNGLNRETIKVPPAQGAGVHQFRAIFEGENVTASVEAAGAGGPSGTAAAAAAAGSGVVGDTLSSNNVADAYTFVRGHGQVLYVDNVFDRTRRPGPGQDLVAALKREGIDLKTISVDDFPSDLISLQNYDAVILANVPRGSGGISDEQGAMLATYVHDLGGGLVMIGGEEAYGAGGWQGSKLEEVLPVNMDIPAQRQIPKGALVLIMHSCEMPDGNYWGELCGLKAVETLSERDEIGVISYGMGGSQWDFPLQEKGDGSRVNAAIKKMQLGDMPSFDDSMTVALHGKNGKGGLINSDARQKHVIIISDGDPGRPSGALIDDYVKNKVSISTITVYPHMGDPDGLPPVMKQVAADTKGRAYGPINNNPNQLPQIFIKEATVVRRTLIHEDKNGIPLVLPPSSSELVKGVGAFPSIYGMVLTSRKNNPQIEVPIVAGKNNDPVLAHWQTGLGRVAVFTSDAHNRWAVNWVGAGMFDKFWAQVVRSVARPPMSSDFDVVTDQVGDKAKITVEALNKDSGFLNFLSVQGAVVGPDNQPREIRLVQTGPGTYTAEFDTPDPGSYVAMLNYRGQNGEEGRLVSGLAVNSSPEMRDLRSNDAVLRQIAERTGGRVLDIFEPASADLFNRQGLTVTASPLPVWDIMIPILLGLILLDVATRRIAWDWQSIRRAAATASDQVRSYTTTRKVETTASLDALKRVRDEVAEQKLKTEGDGQSRTSTPASARPDPRAKFEAKGVEGDISSLVGGATDKPIPPPPKKIEPKGAPTGSGSSMGSLMEAKRRAQQKIQEKEKEA